MVFFRGFQFAVYHADFKTGEKLPEVFIPIIYILQIHFFRFFNQRVDNIHLPTGLYLFVDKTIQRLPLVFVIMVSLNWLATRRKFIDNRNTQIAVKCHG